MRGNNFKGALFDSEIEKTTKANRKVAQLTCLAEEVLKEEVPSISNESGTDKEEVTMTKLLPT